MGRRPTGWLLAVVFLLATGGVRADEVMPAVTYLDALASPQNWRADDARIRRSPTLQADDRPTLHVRVPMEAAAGGADAWPKVLRPVSSDLGGDWKRYDRFEFLAMARLRPPLAAPPKRLALQLLSPDKEHSASVSIRFPELDTWVRVSVPIRDVPDLQRLSTLQLYLAKRWYAGIETADFFVGGFRLVRDAGPVPGEYLLLTPFPGPSQPVLRLEGPPVSAASPTPTPLRIERAGQLLHELAGEAAASGHIEIDLTGLQLPPGRLQLVAFPDAKELRQAMSFDWQPFEIVHADLGERFIGDNIARVAVRNTGADAGTVEISVRLEGTRLATQRLDVPANSVAEARLAWPLVDGQSGKAELEVYTGDRYVGGSDEAVEPPDVLAGAAHPRPVAFEAGQPLSFRLPVSLAEGSRGSARLHWELRDASGAVVGRGEGGLVGPSVGVSVDMPDAWAAGRYTLLATLRWGDGREAKAETPLLILPGPYSM